METKFVDRGFEKTLVLVPGWATDYRVFSHLDLKYNYLLLTKFSPIGFSDNLLNILDKEKLDKVSLFGWSLGGFLAVEFSIKNPKRVDELILVGVRYAYAPELLEGIKLKLRENKEAFLCGLYAASFSEHDALTYQWFKKNLLEDYLSEMDLESLLIGLDYLSRNRIEPEKLLEIKQIKIIHGSLDKIAPIQEARELKEKLPQAEFSFFPESGHAPFLNPNFKL